MTSAASKVARKPVLRDGRALRRAIVKASKSVRDFFVVPVENPSAPGTPDIFACVRGVNFWIEIKYGKEKKRPAQEIWHHDYGVSGGICFTVRETASNEFLAVARGTEYFLKPQHLVDLLTKLAELTRQLQVPVRSAPIKGFSAFEHADIRP